MPISIGEFEKLMDKLAPIKGAYSWDNCGLVVKAGESVGSVLVAFDLTQDVLKEAVRKRCDMILTHHPIMFDPLRRIDCGRGESALICGLIQNGISLYCAHTSMDRAPGGINDELAKRLKLKNIEPIFEEDGYACARLGALPEPMDEAALARYVKEALGFHMVRVSGGGVARNLAVCGGAGSSLVELAAGCGADAFLTGELKYNEHVESGRGRKLILLEAGHMETEQCFVDIALCGLQECVNELLLNVTLTRADLKAPYVYY